MRRLALLIPVAVLAACGGSARRPAPHSLAPLSSLGALRPAPYPGDLGPELIPIPKAPLLAPAASKSSPSHAVHGIKCERNEPIDFHHHVHLTVFVNGEPRQLPAGIGVWPKLEKQSGAFGQFSLTQGECLSWLITRYADGLIHVEAPMQRQFTLGDLFDVWGQPLGTTEVGPAKGKVTAILNGKVWVGDPRDIPLVAHAQVQLEVGTPLVAPEKISFPGAF